MNPHPSHLANQAWQDTLPALRRRRMRRRTVSSATATLLLAALIVALWPNDVPAEYQWISHYGPPAQDQFVPSLAVLIVDQSGARFAEYRAQDLVSEGLQFNLSLEPVITSPVADYF